jgi:DNA-binding LacI/PurR family transcriptional regulator
MPRKRPPAPAPAEPIAMPRARPQMADIARLAGVSVSTVSRALSGSSLIKEDTRVRITELARSLSYSVNVGAQNLRLKQNSTISVIVPFDATSREHLSDPFFLSLIGSLADALTESGYDMLLSRVDAERLDLAAQTFETGRSAGVVLVGQWHHHDQLNELAVRGVPFVVWGAQLPRQLYVTVGSDNTQGGALATGHLLDLGARHIAFLGDPELPEVGQRHAGYLLAHEQRGLVPAPHLTLPTPFVGEVIQRDLDAYVRAGHPLDGMFASSDVSAMTAINTLRRLGRQVPEDVAVVGYDDIALAPHFHPSLTTIRQPIEAAGQALVKALMAQLAGAKPDSVLLPTELVRRESSGTARGPAAAAATSAAPRTRAAPAAPAAPAVSARKAR